MRRLLDTAGFAGLLGIAVLSGCTRMQRVVTSARPWDAVGVNQERMRTNPSVLVVGSSQSAYPATRSLTDLARVDFSGARDRAARLVVAPDSIMVTAGQHIALDRISAVIVDSAGAVLGRTDWLRWSIPESDIVRFYPPALFVAHRAGRVLVSFRLADGAEHLLGRSLERVVVAVIVRAPDDVPNPGSRAAIATDEF